MIVEIIGDSLNQTGLAALKAAAFKNALNAQQQAYLQASTNQAQRLDAHMNAINQRIIADRQPTMRTKEQIIAQLEARYAELEREANSPARTMPCKTCRWRVDRGWDYCAHPLITGLDGEPVSRVNDNEGKRTTALCGPEKALWEEIPPKLPLWQRFKAWFLAPWIEEA